MADSAYAQLVRRAAQWLEQGKVGTAGHTSAQAPFGMNSVDATPFVLGREGDSAYVARVRALAARARWPALVQAAYMVLGDAQREFMKHEWTFSSLCKIEERVAFYAQHGQTRICDLAVRYEGMGHFLVLCVDMSTGRLFQRGDGGGNGWEREHNWKFAKNLDLEALPAAHFHEWDPELPLHATPVRAPWD